MEEIYILSLGDTDGDGGGTGIIQLGKE